MLLDNSRVLSNLNTRVSSNIVSVITRVGSSSTSVQIFLKDADPNNSYRLQVATLNQRVDVVTCLSNIHLTLNSDPGKHAVSKRNKSSV